jgi:hypothetical protein
MSLSKKFIKEQIEIIHKDKNLVCMIPKTQAGSFIYGHKTKWCQLHGGGFESWSKQGLLIRFLLKGGRKIRFTYFFSEQNPYGYMGGEPGASDAKPHMYYWSAENGYHMLFGAESNPFLASPKDSSKIRKTEHDLLDLIKTISPECRQKVLCFIERHAASYPYKYVTKDYETLARRTFDKKYKDADEAITEKMKGLYEHGAYIGTYMDRDLKQFILTHYPRTTDWKYPETKRETFKDVSAFKERAFELIEYYWSLPKVEIPKPIYSYEGEFYHTEDSYF